MTEQQMKPSQTIETWSFPRVLGLIVWTRVISILAVVSSLAGALLMFWLGSVDTVKVFQMVITGEKPVEAVERELSILATIDLLETLDSFLVGLAFLYFAYGIYSLFLRVQVDIENDPKWLQVNSISALKKTLIELLVVLLCVLFVKGALEHVTIQDLQWNVLIVPLSVIALAFGARLLLSGENSET